MSKSDERARRLRLGAAEMETATDVKSHFVGFYAYQNDLCFVEPSRGPTDTHSEGIVPMDIGLGEFEQAAEQGYSISFALCSERARLADFKRVKTEDET